MGSQLSPLLADIYMDHKTEHMTYSNAFYNKIIYWARCFDILAYIRENVNEVQVLLTYLININNNITFMIEMEKDEQKNFLDLHIKIK